MHALVKALGSVVHKPGAGIDALSFGFKTPKAHWLYPMWGNNLQLSEPRDGHHGDGVGFQPIPEWRKGVPYIKEAKNAANSNVVWAGNTAILLQGINDRGLAVTLLDIKYGINNKLYGLNNIDYVLQGTQEAPEEEDEGEEE